MLSARVLTGREHKVLVFQRVNTNRILIYLKEMNKLTPVSDISKMEEC